MITALLKSMKNAPTIGNTRKARGAGAEALHERVHVGHRVRRGAESEAAVPPGHHRRVVVAPHQAEGHEHRERGHHRHLYYQDGQHREGEVEELPQAQRHERHGEEERERDRSQVVDGARGDAHDARSLEQVARHGRHEHRADVRRKRDVLRGPLGDHAAQCHAPEDDGDHLQHHIGGRCLPHRLRVDLGVERRRLGLSRRGGAPRIGHTAGAQLEALNQSRPHRSADDTSRDQPEGGGRHRERDGARQLALFLQQLAECCPRPVPAGHGDGAGNEPEPGVHA
jgi:hypothetical protein